MQRIQTLLLKQDLTFSPHKEVNLKKKKQRKYCNEYSQNIFIVKKKSALTSRIMKIWVGSLSHFKWPLVEIALLWELVMVTVDYCLRWSAT